MGNLFDFETILEASLARYNIYIEEMMMDDLDVKFEFQKNAIIREDIDGDPIYGNVVSVTVNGQVFKQSFKVSGFGVDEKQKNRAEAKLLGEVLKVIGSEIVVQAEKGQPSVVRNGDGEIKAVYF